MSKFKRNYTREQFESAIRDEVQSMTVYDLLQLAYDDLYEYMSQVADDDEFESFMEKWK